jgi:hypothetical protein
MKFYPFNNKDVVLVEGNKAVLDCRGMHLCGYVALPTSSIPSEWHGNYDADALQYLNIHGGLTFCEVYSDDEGAEILNINCVKAINEYRENNDAVSFIDNRIHIREIQQKYNKEIAKLPDSYVVFGFDCGHYRDEEDFNLKDPKYVMNLVEQMEQQLVSYANVINQWRSANEELRIKVIEEIRNLSDIPSELGFGAIIGALGGAKEFKDNKDE